jgi:hypothetical protein
MLGIGADVGCCDAVVFGEQPAIADNTTVAAASQANLVIGPSPRSVRIASQFSGRRRIANLRKPWGRVKIEPFGRTDHDNAVVGCPHEAGRARA